MHDMTNVFLCSLVDTNREEEFMTSPSVFLCSLVDTNREEEFMTRPSSLVDTNWEK